MPTPRVNIEMLELVEELMAIGTRYGPLIAKVCELFSVQPRTVESYMKRVRDHWATEEADKRPIRREELRAKVQATFLKAYAEGGPSLGAAVQCLRIMSKMDGLEAPQQIEIKGQLEIKSMSPQERRARIDELWAIREARSLPAPTKAKAKKLPAPKKKTAAKKTKAKKKVPTKRARKKKAT